MVYGEVGLVLGVHVQRHVALVHKLRLDVVIRQAKLMLDPTVRDCLLNRKAATLIHALVN